MNVRSDPHYRPRLAAVAPRAARCALRTSPPAGTTGELALVDPALAKQGDGGAMT
ncbi:MAG TPA: hypothetical protein VKV36_11980 [Acidimicrobiales bacterium]|nr:hypothetical protein [Acidimicrobiales bacterium]